MNKLRDHKILTFDVVGTLIDFEAGVLNYIRPLVKQAGRNIDDATILLTFAHAETKLHAGPMAGASFTAMLPHIYKAMAEELGLPLSESAVEGLCLSIKEWPPFPDSIAAMKILRKHFRLVATTNADNWSVQAMAKTLEEPFDDTVTAQDVETCKPDPHYFSYTRGSQRAHGFRLADYLHVAQSQFHDIGVAKRLGYDVCWIERRNGQDGYGGSPVPQGGDAKPNYHFFTLGELAAAVENNL